MPYRKKTKGSFAKRLIGRTRYNNYRAGGMQLYRDVKMIKSLINVEKKFCNIYNTGGALASAVVGNVDLLSQIPEGSDFNQRTGRSIKYYNLTIEGQLKLDPAATTDNVKVSVIFDRQLNGGSVPVYNDIYDTAGGTMAGNLCLRSYNTVDRYTVLRELLIPMDANGGQIRKFKIFLKFPNGKDGHCKFSGTTSSSSSIETGAVYLAYCGNNITGTSLIMYSSRIRFIDN